MRVLLLNQYYYPDIAATAQLATDLGEELARRGHEVTAVASDRAYVGDGRLAAREQQRGVQIFRVPSTAFGRTTRLGRVTDYASFLARALGPATRGPRPDVVVALSTPPFIAALGILVKRLRGARLVHWVMDVYPDIAVELGPLDAHSSLTRLLERLARLVLEQSDAVVALDEAMRDRLIARGARAADVEVIDNWCADDIRPAPRETNALRRQLGLGDVFTVSFSGNMGLGQDFATMLGAMRALRDEAVHWLLIGDGPRRAELERAAGELGGARVSFLPYRERAELPVSLTAADAALVGLDDRLAGLRVPSKLYGILAAGVPVLYVGPPEGRVARVVHDDQVGVAVANGDVAGLAGAIRALKADPARRSELGRRAREVFERRFSRAAALERHHDLLCRVAARC